MIREINFTVSAETVTPLSKQFGGIAGEHNATQLSFTIEKALLEKIQQQADVSKELKYRFDCFDSCGALYSTKSEAFTGETVTLPLGENITRLGGEAKIVLVVTLLNAESKTEMELLSVPVSVYFKGVPFASGKLDESRESLTSLEQSAKKAAAQANSSEGNAKSKAEEASNSADDAAGYAGEAKKAFEDAQAAAEEAKNQKINAEEMLDTHKTNPHAHGLQNAVFKDEYGNVQLGQANVFAGMFRAVMGAFDTLQTPNEETGEFENVVTESSFLKVLKALSVKMPIFGTVQVLKSDPQKGYVYVEPESLEDIKNPIDISFDMSGNPTVKPKNNNGKLKGFDYGGGCIFGDLQMMGNRITMLPSPTQNGEAVNKFYADNLLKANDAMVFKGTLGEGGTITSVPTGSAGYKSGWTYKIITAGTYAGQFCEVGDMLICINSYAGATNPMFVTNEDWVVVQGNTTTDLTYNPESKNAQSGRAIKEAFENVPYPQADNEAANKVYVDNQIGQITSVLSTLVDPSEV